jgi:hypothetical protein
MWVETLFLLTNFSSHDNFTEKDNNMCPFSWKMGMFWGRSSRNKIPVAERSEKSALHCSSRLSLLLMIHLNQRARLRPQAFQIAYPTPPGAFEAHTVMVSVGLLSKPATGKGGKPMRQPRQLEGIPLWVWWEHVSVKRVASSVAVVQFSSVHRHISPNLELDHWSSLGKSLNPNLNLPEWFFQSSSGFGEVENPNQTEIFYFIFIFYFWKALNQKNIWVRVHRGSWTRPKVQSEGMQTCKEWYSDIVNQTHGQSIGVGHRKRHDQHEWICH